MFFRPAHASVSIAVAGEGRRVLRLLNDTHHLTKAEGDLGSYYRASGTSWASGRGFSIPGPHSLHPTVPREPRRAPESTSLGCVPIEQRVLHLILRVRQCCAVFSPRLALHNLQDVIHRIALVT